MNVNLNNYMEKIRNSYMLVLSYGSEKDFLIKEIYSANLIVDENYNPVSKDKVLEYNIFLLEKYLNHKMIFKSTTNSNNKIVMPLYLVEKIFNSKTTITPEMISLFNISSLIFEEKTSFLDYIKNSFIKLSEIDAEYIYNGNLNNDNYSIIPIRLNQENYLTDILATLPFKEYSKIKIK